ncbi:MAG: tRNA (adenosine(37)-N6)-threonylcarbamoyltransferase complex dimerization subunit type 1 TsaB [Bdellovibrionota bacterium]
MAIHLAIDTAASRPTAAVMNGERVLAEWLGPGALKHHETLLAGVDECLRTAGLPLSDLAFLSVGVGPGLFTGLRIGVITAKFLADPLSLPCVSVSSLLALALQSGAVGKGRVWCLGDAKSRRVYALPVDEFTPDFSSPPGEEVAITPEEAAARMKPGDLLIGEGALLYKDLWPSGTQLFPENAHALTAGAVGALGARRYALALTCTATELEPKYLKTGQPHL